MLCSVDCANAPPANSTLAKAAVAAYRKPCRILDRKNRRAIMSKKPDTSAPPGPADTTAKNTSPELRKRLLAARAALTVTQRQAAAHAIMRHLRTGLSDSPAGTILRSTPGRRPIVAAFWPMPDEPDLRDLLTEWSGQDYDIALPTIRHRGAPLVFLRWQPEAPMRAGAYGIAEPDGTPECVPDVLLVPTLGYTSMADRIGYGGGYYDRTLAAMTRAGLRHATIGVAWSCARLAPGTHQPAAHDMPLDAVVDENGWVIPAS